MLRKYSASVSVLVDFLCNVTSFSLSSTMERPPPLLREYCKYKYPIGISSNKFLRIIVAEDRHLNMPRISVCLDPPTSFDRLSKLGLAPDSWNIKLFMYDVARTSLLFSEEIGHLFDKSMYSFEEVFKTVIFGEDKTWKKTSTVNHRVNQWFKCGNELRILDQ